MIATQVADYILGKQIEGTRKERWDVFPSGPSLLDSTNKIGTEWIGKIIWPGALKGTVSKIKGVTVSDGDAISDDQIIKSYSESWPKMVGIEMESGGVAAGVHQTLIVPNLLR